MRFIINLETAARNICSSWLVEKIRHGRLQVLSREDVAGVLRLAARERLVVMADEVYQALAPHIHAASTTVQFGFLFDRLKCSLF